MITASIQVPYAAPEKNILAIKTISKKYLKKKKTLRKTSRQQTKVNHVLGRFWDGNFNSNSDVIYELGTQQPTGRTIMSFP